MIRTKSPANDKPFLRSVLSPRACAFFWLLLLGCWWQSAASNLFADESGAPQNSPASSPDTIATAAVETNAAPHYNVRAYAIEGNTLLPASTLTPMLSKYSGTNVGLEEIVQAASDLQLEYRNRGHPTVSIVIGEQQITNGTVTMNVFEGAFSQIVISGKRYLSSSNGGAGVASNLSTANATTPSSAPAAVATNAAPAAVTTTAAPATAATNPAPVADLASPTPAAVTTNGAPAAVATTAAPAAALAGVSSRDLRSITSLEFPPRLHLYMGPPEVMKRVEEALHREMAELDALASGTNAALVPTQIILAPVKPKDQITNLREVLDLKIAELDAQDRRSLLFPGGGTNSMTSTNGPVFEVKGYELIGNTLLPPDLTDLILQPYIGPKVTFDLIRRGLTELRTVYDDRGYVTVSVGLPQQTLSNGIVKIRVFQGRLSEIIVAGNHYFSSDNIMRALPSLHTNMILDRPVFQAELDRANANQDRQIYPQIEPGPEENTTKLLLTVKDQLPLHAKAELDNYNTPDTPDLRVNTSAVYDNLWQLEHALGVQYSFSPEYYKMGESWNSYDKPLIANYSAFYRLLLGYPEPVENVIAKNPGNFGYDEATRKFRLPPSAGNPTLSLYASRSTTDTGIATLLSTNLYSTNGNSLYRQDQQRDLTTTSDIGSRLSLPLTMTENFQSGLSLGPDFKTYELNSYKTNIFTLRTVQIDTSSGSPTPVTNIVTSVDRSPVPASGVTSHSLNYLPLAIGYNANWRDALGTTMFGLGLSGNCWFSGSVKNLQSVTGSSESTGYWVVLNPSLSREINIYTNWTLSLHVDGQWASQPLISNEQYGVGGVSSVRGYHQGEVFGDMGWQVLCEQKTPPHVVGMVYGKQTLTIRGSIYMGYAETYLIDTPKGSERNGQLWGTGFGGVAAIGSHLEARFMFSWPLLSTATTEAYQPRFDFALTAQF